MTRYVIPKVCFTSQSQAGSKQSSWNQWSEIYELDEEHEVGNDKQVSEMLGTRIQKGVGVQPANDFSS